MVVVGSFGLCWNALWSGDVGGMSKDCPINCISQALSMMNVSWSDGGACDLMLCIVAGFSS